VASGHEHVGPVDNDLLRSSGDRRQPRRALAIDRLRAGGDRNPRRKRGVARDPKTLPELERQRSNGNGAIVELLKVLLRMTSEQNAVAAKVIATVDDLEAIAVNDKADVPALHGWRREMFGEKALSLKRGKLSLAIERGRVVAHETPEAG